jgi:hypothetical protein
VIDARGRVRYSALGGLVRATTRDSLLAMARAASRDTTDDPRTDPPRAFPPALEVPP